jgi:hypothetical protein
MKTTNKTKIIKPKFSRSTKGQKTKKVGGGIQKKTKKKKILKLQKYIY